MLVYVISKDGQPLMPTSRNKHVRILLKTKQAKIVNRTPFTIQLCYDSTMYTQEITLGVDAGTKHIGLSECVILNVHHLEITKNTRIINKLEKSHIIDARCISGNVLATPTDNSNVYMYKQIRKHNRQIHKANKIKGGRLKLNQARFEVFGFRLFDKVLYNNQVCFVKGRRSTGYFELKTITGKKIHDSAKYTNLKKLERAKTFVIDVY